MTLKDKYKERRLPEKGEDPRLGPDAPQIMVPRLHAISEFQTLDEAHVNGGGRFRVWDVERKPVLYGARWTMRMESMDMPGLNLGPARIQSCPKSRFLTDLTCDKLQT